MSSTSVPTITGEFNAPGEEVLSNPNLVISDLFAWNARHNPSYPLFRWNDGGELRHITYSTANEAMVRSARYALVSMGPSTDPTSPPRRVVAVLANTDTITYFTTVIGTLKAGFTLFLISPRNAPVAVADMLQRTGATHILVSPDASMQGLAKEAIAILKESGTHVAQHAMPVFEDLYPGKPDPSSPFEANVEMCTSYDVAGPAVIMHSSGSTGHPKPLAWSHSRLISLGYNTMYRRAINYTGCIMGSHGAPLFHAMGAFLYCAAPTTGFIVATLKPSSPPIAPTPEAVWDGFVSTGVDYSFNVPSFVEQWARDSEKVVVMQKMRGIIFGGAALNDDIGNTLAAQGVSLHSLYGATEVGLINDFSRPDPGRDWSYICMAPEVKCMFRPLGDGKYEPVVISSPELPLPKVNTKVEESDAYAMSDAVVPHPTRPDLWKIVGRLDEQIILSNGEKTNPIPLEKMINEDPHVKCSVMFGRGRFQNGVLVEPTEEYAIDPSDEKQVAAFRNMIWSTIERVNAFAPQHSRIFKEMILITHPSKPFQFNVKGLPRRGIILSDYENEIESLYQQVESTVQSDIAPPASWDADGTLTFIRAVVENTLQHPIPDDADIFRNGGDSLQATWIRNTILGAMRAAHPAAAKRVPMNLVFAFPTVSALARTVSSIVNGGEDIHADPTTSTRTPNDLWQYVERFSADLPARPAQLVPRTPGAKDVVLVTGTTGGFGCDALEHFLRDETIARVYAFNRKGSRAMERQRTQFARRGLDEKLLDSDKFVMVEAVLHEPGFGIDAGLLEEIRCSVTHIMLNAWKVNFNMSIASFEVDIQGVRNFVDLALSSPYTVPPVVVFISSVGVFTNYKLTSPVPEAPLNDPESPFGSGYPESKWVTEHFLENVARQTDVHTVVVRLGQVTGDRLGYWNEKEWFPALVKTALHQRCLPDMEGTVSWFPAYEAAEAFTQMRRSREPLLHLVHPHPVPWHTLVEPIATQLGVPLVPYAEWLAALEQSASATAGSANEVEVMAKNPALQLIEFFKVQSEASAEGLEREPMGLVMLSTEKSTRVSEALANLPQLDTARALTWVAAWKKAGFL